MSERAARPPPPDADEPRLPFTERWVAPFVREPLLWPVGIVLLAHAVALLAPVLLLALRDHGLGALGALTALVVLSGAAVRAELARLHRPGVACALLATTWGLATAVALAAHRTGIF